MDMNVNLCYNQKVEGMQGHGLCMVVMTRATLNVWRVITSLSRLRGNEGGGICFNHMDIGN